MFPNDLQREALSIDTVETLFFKFLLTFGVHTFTNAITILPRRDMSYPTFSFGCICGPRQISKHMPLRNWLSTNRDPFKYSLFSTQSVRRFQTFDS